MQFFVKGCNSWKVGALDLPIISIIIRIFSKYLFFYVKSYKYVSHF